LQFQRNAKCRNCGTEKTMPQSNANMMEMMMGAMGCKGGCGDSGGFNSGGYNSGGFNYNPNNIPHIPRVAWHDPDVFLTLNFVEEPAAAAFRELPESMQQLVIAAGSLGGSRDPGAVLVGRIGKARKGQLQPQTPKNPGDWFCSGCADLQFARNVKCRNCGTEKPMPQGCEGLPPAKKEEVEQYIAQNAIQEPASSRLRDLPPNTQAIVLASGGLAGARDSTAVLLARIGKARKGLLTPQTAQNPGDWYCPGCSDLQFARNLKCRNCGMEKPMPQNLESLPAATKEEVEHYIMSNSVQEPASSRLRELPPHVQAVVVAAGGLGGARDSTAVLLARIGKAKKGELQPEQKKAGDWDCAVCGDHQFARNAVCRTCKNPNPNAMQTPNQMPMQMQQPMFAQSFFSLP